MQPTKKNQPRRSRDQWKSLIDRHAQSGLSCKAFCDREALSYASFVKWRSTLKSSSADNAEGFVELRAQAQGVEMPSDEACSSECLAELQIGSSVTVRIYARQ